MKWRADQVAERVDAALLHNHENPRAVLRRLNAAKLRAVILYREGRINKEGFERVCEHVKVLVEVFQAQCERQGKSGVSQRVIQTSSPGMASS